MYKRIMLSVVFCLATGPLSLSVAFGQENPSGDKIVESYLQALGGQKALAAIQDRTSKGSFTVFGMTGTLLAHEKVPNKSHQLIDMGMAKVETWFDGTQGYRINPTKGDGPFTAEEIAQAKNNFAISPFLTYKDRGVKLRYVKKEKVGASDADVVEATDAEGKVITYYFDAANHYLVKMVAPVPDSDGGGSLELEFSDYRDVSGVKFPCKTVGTTTALIFETVVDSIEVNTGLADTVFQQSAN